MDFELQAWCLLNSCVEQLKKFQFQPRKGNVVHDAILNNEVLITSLAAELSDLKKGEKIRFTLEEDLDTLEIHLRFGTSKPTKQTIAFANQLYTRAIHFAAVGIAVAL